MATICVDTNAGEDPLFAGLVGEFGEEYVKRQRLDIGDVEVRSEKFGRIIFERKSWHDFVSSLRDGRYHEQKGRLLAERERSTAEGKQLRVVYLLETSRVPAYDDCTWGMKHNQPYAALVKMALRDSICIIYSASAADSYKHIIYTVKAGLVGGLDAGAHAHAVAASGYAGTVRFAAKRKCTDENMFEIMLASLNGVSGTKASAITAVYDSPAALVRAYIAMADGGATEKALDNMLADVKVGEKRLGPAISKKLRIAFYKD
jgi:ERCC4-type nuclease